MSPSVHQRGQPNFPPVPDLMFLAPQYVARTWYCDPAGSDGAAGNQDTPLRSPDEALRRTPRALANGSRVRIVCAAGSYDFPSFGQRYFEGDALIWFDALNAMTEVVPEFIIPAGSTSFALNSDVALPVDDSTRTGRFVEYWNPASPSSRYARTVLDTTAAAYVVGRTLAPIPAAGWRARLRTPAVRFTVTASGRHGGFLESSGGNGMLLDGAWAGGAAFFGIELAADSAHPFGAELVLAGPGFAYFYMCAAPPAATVPLSLSAQRGFTLCSGRDNQYFMTTNPAAIPFALGIAPSTVAWAATGLADPSRAATLTTDGTQCTHVNEGALLPSFVAQWTNLSDSTVSADASRLYGLWFPAVIASLTSHNFCFTSLNPTNELRSIWGTSTSTIAQLQAARMYVGQVALRTAQTFFRLEHEATLQVPFPSLLTGAATQIAVLCGAGGGKAIFSGAAPVMTGAALIAGNPAAYQAGQNPGEYGDAAAVTTAGLSKPAWGSLIART